MIPLFDEYFLISTKVMFFTKIRLIFEKDFSERVFPESDGKEKTRRKLLRRVGVAYFLFLLIGKRKIPITNISQRSDA